MLYSEISPNHSVCPAQYPDLLPTAEYSTGMPPVINAGFTACDSRTLMELETRALDSALGRNAKPEELELVSKSSC